MDNTEQTAPKDPAKAPEDNLTKLSQSDIAQMIARAKSRHIRDMFRKQGGAFGGTARHNRKR